MLVIFYEVHIFKTIADILHIIKRGNTFLKVFLQPV